MRTVVGIDIGFDALKVVGLGRQGKTWRLIGLNSAGIPAGSWDTVELKNQAEIAKVIRSALRSAKPSSINAKEAMVALPESVIFAGVIAVPKLPSNELKKTVPFEAAEKLSINLEEYHLDFEVSSSKCQPSDQGLAGKAGSKPKTASDPDKVTVFAVAAKQTLVKSVIELCRLAHLELAGLDIKPGAIVRAVVEKEDGRPRLILDLGASATGASVAEGQSLRLVSTVPLGTRAMVKNQADPLSDFRSNGTAIFDEVVHLTKFFENRACPGAKIEEVLLTGGGSNIKGIVELFQEQTGLKTRINNPFSRVNLDHYPLGQEIAVTYSEAVGLAMRDN